MPTCNKIQIVFAPLPEERDVETSAAKEFALRAAERFRDDSGAEECSSVEIHHLADWNKDILFSSPIDECDGNDVVATNGSTIVFLISCGPDGSVHRSARKTTKWIKEQEAKINPDDTGSEKLSPVSTTAVIALLGHAVCKTSAEQMDDEVYSAGRRLAKSLQRICAAPVHTTPVPSLLLETQVELEAPEERFDGWVTSWADALQQ